MAVPKIRFPGFTEDWEQRKFESQYKKLTEKNDLSFGPDKIISVANMYFRSDTSKSDDEYMKTYNVMRIGDIAFEGNKSKNFAHGRFVENTIGDGIVSHVFDVFRPIADYDLLFWKYLINNENIMGRVMTRCTKASTMMTNLVAKDFLKESVLVPTIKEQHKIGSFLDCLDKTITLHQRKLEGMKLLKKSLLQKMFPKSGESVPEVRFPGFTDAWEQRKLSNYMSDFIVPMRDKPKVFSGNIPWTRIEDIEGKYLNGSLSQQYVSTETIKIMNLKVIPKGSLIVSSSATFGVVAVVTRDLITNQTFIGLVPKEKETVDYWYSFFQSTQARTYMRMESAGSTIFYITREKFENMPVTAPGKLEMLEIGSFFSRLDQIITLHQRKVEILHKLKKSLLQQMFV